MEAKETPRRILEAAADVFAEAGFAGARIDEIARRAGVNKAAIYYHVGDKEALYGRVLHDVFAEAYGRVRRDVDAAPSPEEKLRAYIRNVARTVEGNPHMPRILLREVAGGGIHFPESVVREMAALIQILSEVLAEGRETGVFGPAIPVVIHMMIIGTTVMVRASKPIRDRFEVFPESIRTLEARLPQGVAGAVEPLILNAVKAVSKPEDQRGETP